MLKGFKLPILAFTYYLRIVYLALRRPRYYFRRRYYRYRR